jgi:Ca2+-binding EF-hand superfamily protein
MSSSSPRPSSTASPAADNNADHTSQTKSNNNNNNKKKPIRTSVFSFLRIKKMKKNNNKSSAEQVHDDKIEKLKQEETRIAERNNASTLTSSVLVEQKARGDFDAKDKANSDSGRSSLFALAYSQKINSRTTTQTNYDDNSNRRGASTRKATATTTNSSSSSWFCGTNYFKKMCEDVFDSIDDDKSGQIEEHELYTGLLLIHLKLGMYAGPAACKPISRQNCQQLFHTLDIDSNGRLDKQEFQNVLPILMGNVISRILFQLLCTLAIVPFLAQFFLKNGYQVYQFLFLYIDCIITDYYLPIFYDKYHPLLKVAFGWDLLQKYGTLAITKISNVVDVADIATSIVHNITNYLIQKYDVLLNMIPNDTWRTLPLTLLSTILTMLIVPWTIIKTDQLFQYLATNTTKYSVKSKSKSK